MYKHVKVQLVADSNSLVIVAKAGVLGFIFATEVLDSVAVLQVFNKSYAIV